MRIGLIQTGSPRDIVIALPIAQWFVKSGHQVFWPVMEDCLAWLAAAMPQVEFLPVPEGLSPLFAYHDLPMALLHEAGCDRIFPLYSQLGSTSIADEHLAFSLKFDEYKYAVTGVPFVKKWALAECLRRDALREQAVLDELQVTRNYILVDATSSTVKLPEEWSLNHDIRTVPDPGGNPFDWLAPLEGASRLVIGDGLLSSLADQMNITADKHLVVSSGLSTTPVYANGWRFLLPGETI